MKISSTFGNFRIIQTIQNKDQLLVIGTWADLVKLFDSGRTFLVNKPEQLFGVYLCKQECAEFLVKLLQDIDYKEFEKLKMEQNLFDKHYLA
ncbi:hypothetical protein [Algoriphagus vanfongensis]|uniref:hypothetical protein n=1 Tax=Algoriphagus vanfongensis TaxID=426371 RepID=UPI00041F3157|nr:hypothetical protein [Algoriphagus vanfongensis]